MATISIDGLAASGADQPRIDADGAAWVWTTIEGWWGGLSPRAAPLQPPDGADGDMDGQVSATARNVQIAGTVSCPSERIVLTVLDVIAGVLAGNRRGVLVIDEAPDGQARQATVRLGGPTLAKRQGKHAVDFSLALYAADPLRYSTTLYRISTGRHVVATGGRPSPHPLPFVYATSGGASGLVEAANSGTANTWPIIRFAGPLTNPSLRIVGGPRVAYLLQLAGDQELVVDTRTQSAMIGDASRDAFLAFDARFFPLPPELTSLLFEADDGDGICTIEWRDATL